MKLASLPWLLIPGFGQIRFGAPGLGVVAFAIFLLALNGWLLGSLLTDGESAPLALGAFAALLWITSFADGLRRAGRARS